jgi:hypothetical protein
MYATVEKRSSLSKPECQGRGKRELWLQDNNNKAEEKESEEDLWLLWGKIINEWEIWWKKRTPQTKVRPWSTN